MLSILIFCIYISFLCWTWGLATRNLFVKLTGEPIQLPASITCLLGMVVITSIGGFLSFWLPLGGPYIQLIFLIPALVISFQKTTTTEFRKLRNKFRSINNYLLFYFFSALLLLILIGSWIIYHPDTMAYHAQLIKWIEEYKVVPGLVNLNARFGFQSSWFVSSALFSFNFTNTGALSFINTTILAWYMLFIIARINSCFFLKQGNTNRLFWLILPLFNFWSFTQIRLTAISASPDFIATIFIGAVFYLLLKSGESKTNSTLWTLILVFTSYSISIKFSALPIAIVGLYAITRLIQLSKKRSLAIAVIFSILILSPFLARNVITSGYAFYPSTIANYFDVDWKYSIPQAKLQEEYITAYARTTGGDTPAEINQILAMRFSEWGPVWWKNRSNADKIILMISGFSILICLAFVKRILRSDNSLKVAFITSIIGIVFWFLKAPDPRFGFGFILMPPVLLCLIFLHIKWTDTVLRKFAIWVLLISALILNAYSFYRFRSYFNPRQLILPAGFEITTTRQVNCGEIIYNLADENNPCGNSPLPCSYDSCQTFKLRGKTMEEGFRAP